MAPDPIPPGQSSGPVITGQRMDLIPACGADQSIVTGRAGQLVGYRQFGGNDHKASQDAREPEVAKHQALSKQTSRVSF